MKAIAEVHNVRLDSDYPSLTYAILLENRLPYEKTIGVYFIWRRDKLVYIGESANIMQRLAQHTRDKAFDSFCYIEMKHSLPYERQKLEKRYQEQFHCKHYNDGLTYKQALQRGVAA